VQSRLALIPLVALLALAAPAATAAPKAAPKPVKAAPTCNTIIDPAGDTFAARSQDQQGAYGPQDDSLDILSADLASDGKVVTAAVRIKTLSRAISTSPTGLTVGLGFLIGTGDTVVRLQAVLPSGQEDRFEVAAIAPDALPNQPATFVGTVTGVVDLPKNEIRITAPAAMLAPYGTLAPGTKLFPNEAESATASRAVPPITSTPGQPMTTRGPFADIAAGGKAVKVGELSCVVPGK
jgi:hypothetical protein